MASRLFVELRTEEESELLWQAARDNCRSPREQAAFFLSQALLAYGREFAVGKAQAHPLDAEAVA
jgi:hypothetical protein